MCKTEMKIVSSEYIPYDIDSWWGGGCGETDWWPDSYGEGVKLMKSDAGSAYICPSNSRGYRRIYVDAAGQAWRIGGLKGARGYPYSISPDDGEVERILSCAAKEFPEVASKLDRFSGRGDALREGPAALLAGAEVLLGKIDGRKWRLRFTDWAVEVFQTSGILQGERMGFFVDGAHIFSSWDTPGDICGLDTSVSCGTDAKNRFRRFGGDDEIAEPLSLLKGAREAATGYDRLLIDIAIGIYERSREITKEVRLFEEACSMKSEANQGDSPAGWPPR